MNGLEYTYLLKNSTNIDALKTQELEKIVNEFPYFQSARALWLKGLYNTNSYHYNTALKITAAYTINREVLFNFITSPIFINEQITTPKNISTKKVKVVPQKSNKITHTTINKKETSKAKSEKPSKITHQARATLEIGKPLTFNSTESHSFNEWMQLVSKKPILKKEKSNNKKAIIDAFINTNPKIKPVDKTTVNSDISSESLKENESLMTETLAKVYLEQKKYENAIKAYHILSLKYPEKSGFFADRIKAIKILQTNKS
jgi:hypothetical protein